MHNAPFVKYQQREKNTCCFSSLASAFHALGDERAELAIANRIKTSLHVVPDLYKTRLSYAKDVLSSSRRVRERGEPRLRYSIVEYTEKNKFNPVAEVYNGVTLLQLEDLKGSRNHCVTVAGRWVFDSNLERALPLSYESLHFVCSEVDDSSSQLAYF